MAKGLRCPMCGKSTLQPRDSVYRCSSKNCAGFVGWGIGDRIVNPGSGKGRECPNCHCNTLHGVHDYEKKKLIWRCTTCYYSGIG
jgi:hypothetical protein